MNPRALAALFLVAVFALGAAVLAARARNEEPPARERPLRFEGATIPRGLPAPDFSLTNQSGERVTMRGLRGRPVIVTFLYSNCDETCPAQAQVVKGALDQLGKDVPALAIAVDPPRDTEQSARGFLAKQRMTGRMDFVLGSRRELRPLWRGYAIRPQEVTREHQGRYVLIDPRGRQRVGFPLDQATPERIAHDIRLLARGT